MSWVRRSIFVALIATGFIGLVDSSALGAQTQQTVMVAQVHGTIDPGLSPYIKRVLGDATEQGSEAVILDINTPGGRLDSALEIKDALLGSQVPVVAFINREAFSAGALIAVAADAIYMTPGASMGAATPVDQAGDKASEKVVSAVRTAFMSTAEARGRDPLIAEAMVDETVAVEGLVEEGKLLTLTTATALEHGYADGEVRDLKELLGAEGLSDAVVVQTAPSWSEALVRVITNPALASLFISLGFLGLFVELTSPGFGVPGIVGLALLSLFFWGHFLAGLAGWEGIILVVVGLGLLAVELLLVPGFGIAGILGLGAFLGGLFLSLIGQGADSADFLRAALVVLVALLNIVVGGWLILRFVPGARLFRGLALQVALPTGPGIAEEQGAPRVDLRQTERRDGPRTGAGPLLGAQGTAITELRPAGMAKIDNDRVDVITQGEYVAAGTPIEVIADEGYRRVVRPINDAAGPSAS